MSVWLFWSIMIILLLIGILLTVYLVNDTKLQRKKKITKAQNTFPKINNFKKEKYFPIEKKDIVINIPKKELLYYEGNHNVYKAKQARVNKSAKVGTSKIGMIYANLGKGYQVDEYRWTKISNGKNIVYITSEYIRFINDLSNYNLAIKSIKGIYLDKNLKSIIFISNKTLNIKIKFQTKEVAKNIANMIFNLKSY